MVEPSKRRLSSLRDYLKRRSRSTLSSSRTSTLTLLVSLEERELQESSRDSVWSTCRRRPTEVGEESGVSEDGTLPTWDTLWLEPVNWVSTTEPRSTRRSTESESTTTNTQAQLRPISPRSTLLPWEVSPTMERSETTS